MATASKSEGAAPKKAAYKVIGPLRHGELVDGKVVQDDYVPGDTVQLTEAQAAPLLGHTVEPAKG